MSESTPVSEVYRKKAILAEEISALLTRFREETGVSDVQISVQHIRQFAGGLMCVVGYIVNIEVRI